MTPHLRIGGRFSTTAPAPNEGVEEPVQYLLGYPTCGRHCGGHPNCIHEGGGAGVRRGVNYFSTSPPRRAATTGPSRTADSIDAPHVAADRRHLIAARSRRTPGR